MSLKQKTISGVVWSFAEALFLKGLSFIAMLFLARWLGPIDFGLIGMIAVFIGVGTSLVDSGMSSSLIRTKNADDSDFTTVFYMNMAISLLVYALMFYAAPYISTFYGQEVLIDIIRIYCLVFIISAFSAVQLAILNKEMRFKKIMLLNAPSIIIGVSVGLFLGYNNYGVWSIVTMYMTTQIILSLLLWITGSWKPSLNFSKKKLKYHYNFGYKIMLSGLLDVVFTNSYNIIIGKFFPVQTLGYYERARRFTQYPSLTITSIVSKVTYPMFAQLQDDTSKLSKIFRSLLRISFFIIAPLMLGLAAIAEPLFDLILGHEWLAAVPYFQVLSLAAMLFPIHAFNVNVLKVYGRSDIFLFLDIIKKSFLVLALIIGFQFGVIGMIWGSVVVSFFSLLINTHYSSKLIDYSTKRQLLDMLPILLLACLTFLLMHFSVYLFIDYSNIAQITIASLIGITFYLLIHSFFKASPLYALLTIIKNRKL
ncbi:lipopolysaccharide biosynthesis protein [Maribacter polysaccharolyticus]|uniref:lipopolysaccharide biosynthesis protein n=1 Tax=Maribacter polysaccharolyticus TaxID=3020831 RepID=UPI00237F6EFB|nr:lipopolysaccharide biosynthesis protein [Maribacter polysaccharolyticus]MDE3743496.1 lipopolysaccharide biosynthesis protein [Maribacter polysaccharolyticus]